MNENRASRRILVALDASPDSLAAVQAATQLASLLRARLVGLFVEDERILRVSESPLAREVDFLTSAYRQLDSHTVETHLRAQAQRARCLFEEAVSPHALAHEFSVRRGRLVEEVLAAARGVELVSLGTAGWSLRGRRRLGSVARAILDQRHRLLVARGKLRLEHPLALVYLGGEASAQALALALRIAQAGRLGLRILALGIPEEPERERVVRSLQAWDVEVELQWLGATDKERLAQRIGSRTSLLLLPFCGGQSDEELLQKLFDRLSCPLLLVAPSEEAP